MATPLRQPASIASAATTGTSLDLLKATRDLIAKALDDGVPPRDLASLTKRLLEITKEIEAADAGKRDGVGRAASTPDAAWPAA